MKKRVVITGLGAVTPVGNTAQAMWDSLIKGVSGAGPITLVEKEKIDRVPTRIACEVKNFEPPKTVSHKLLKRSARFVQLALAASDMAMRDAKVEIANEDPFRCGVVIGSGIGGLQVTEEQHARCLEKGPDNVSPFMIPMLIVNMASGIVSIQHNLKGPNTCVATACASGSNAIGDAFKIIQRGDADLMLAGGSEASITWLGITGFAAMKALSTRNDDYKTASRPFDRDRDGFVMGEGAGILILEELEHAKKRNATIYAEIVGYGMTSDANHITQPDPTGAGATKCMELAMKDAGIRPQDVDYINAHGTSTNLNDKIETAAIKKALGEDVARKVPVSSTKSMTGHCLGAAGGVESVVCALAIKYDLLPPTINYKTPDPECDLDYVPNQARAKKVRYCLSNSLGFGGHNATLAFKKFEE
jgi:3-oxoacyl-[acyl-carrier-protein] synthase II